MNSGTIWAFDLGKGSIGNPNNDIQPVSKEALIGAIKKCHQTLWAGSKLSRLATV